jgi:glutaredoxin 3
MEREQLSRCQMISPFEYLKTQIFGRRVKKPVDMVDLKKQKKVVIYTTQFCPYCVRALALLKSKNLEIDNIAIDANPALRSEMIEKSKRFTVPQIWVGDAHVGGCDELYMLERQGTLDNLIMGNET